MLIPHPFHLHCLGWMEGWRVRVRWRAFGLRRKEASETEGKRRTEQTKGESELKTWISAAVPSSSLFLPFAKLWQSCCQSLPRVNHLWALLKVSACWSAFLLISTHPGFVQLSNHLFHEFALLKWESLVRSLLSSKSGSLSLIIVDMPV